MNYAPSSLTWLHENEYTATHLKIKKLRVPRERRREISEADVIRLITWVPTRTHEVEMRMSLAFNIFADTGIRVGELLSIEVGQIDLERRFMILVGKGGHERYVPLSTNLVALIRQFLKRKCLRSFKGKSKFLFPNYRNGGLLRPRNFYRDAVNTMRRLGIDVDSFKGMFHALRRNFAKHYLRNDGNLLYLREAMGHTNLEITKSYVEVEPQDLIREHDKTSVLTHLKPKPKARLVKKPRGESPQH